MPATLATPSPLEAMRLVVGIVKSAASLQRFLIGQIKLTRIHVLPVFLPGVRVKRDSGASLYNVERSANFSFAGSIGKLCLFALATECVFGRGRDHRRHQKNGGARRDRTDDILLAKQALSQLSYGPISWQPAPYLKDMNWLARVDSNHRPHAYQACALTT